MHRLVGLGLVLGLAPAAAFAERAGAGADSAESSANPTIGPVTAEGWCALEPPVALGSDSRSASASGSGFAVAATPTAPGAAPAAAAAAVSNIIFVNRCRGGCRYTKATVANAITNHIASGGDIPIGSQYMVSEFGFGDAVWNDFVTCIKEVYAPYNVQIVETDPSPAPHHEAIVAGTAADFAFQGGVLGQAGGGGCQSTDNAVSINAANSHTGFPGLSIADQICWTVAQETAHTWGLDHAFDCTDSMTYIPSCGRKYFRNKNLRCGESAARPCRCGGDTQNSHTKVLATFGAGTGPQLLPTLRIDRPASGATFPAGEAVFVTASSKRGLSHLEVLVNGWRWVDQRATTNSSYQIVLPAEVPDGVMDLKVRACDDIEVCAEQQVTVTRGAPCATADTCALGQRCDSGRCLWDPPTLDLGAVCTFDQACVSLACEDLGGASLVCTQPCVGGPNDVCPDGFTCDGAVGEQGFCAAGDGGGEAPGGCCSSGGGRPMTSTLGLGLVVGLAMVRRRRR